MKIHELNAESKLLNVKLFEDYKKELKDSNALKILLSSNIDSMAKSESAPTVKEEFFYKSYNGYVLDQYDSKNEKVKEIKIPFDKSLIIEVKEKIDEYFDYNETYFGNGNIRSKTISSSLGFEIDKKYYFDEKGKTTEITDTDKGYSFTYEDVFRFCIENKIPLKTEGFPLKIMKTTLQDETKAWVIEYPNSEIQKIEVYILNATSGELINKDLRDWPVFKHKAQQKQ